jgi:hypothetical protein
VCLLELGLPSYLGSTSTIRFSAAMLILRLYSKAPEKFVYTHYYVHERTDALPVARYLDDLELRSAWQLLQRGMLAPRSIGIS